MFYPWKKKCGITFGILLSASLLIYACGGDTTTTATNPADSKSASAATKSVVNALGTSNAGTGASKASFKAEGTGSENDAKLIRKGLDALKAQLQVQGDRQKTLQTVTTLPLINCGKGGTESIALDDNNTPTNPNDDTITTTFTNVENLAAQGGMSLKTVRLR